MGEVTEVTSEGKEGKKVNCLVGRDGETDG